MLTLCLSVEARDSAVYLKRNMLTLCLFVEEYADTLSMCEGTYWRFVYLQRNMRTLCLSAGAHDDTVYLDGAEHVDALSIC